MYVFLVFLFHIIWKSNMDMEKWLIMLIWHPLVSNLSMGLWFSFFLSSHCSPFLLELEAISTYNIILRALSLRWCTHAPCNLYNLFQGHRRHHIHLSRLHWQQQSANAHFENYINLIDNPSLTQTAQLIRATTRCWGQATSESLQPMPTRREPWSVACDKPSGFYLWGLLNQSEP